MAGTLLSSAHREKESHLKDWVRNELGAIDHELRVAAIAGKLFDVTRRWHSLGGAELRLLTLASIVHDVGRSICTKGHAEEGARMLAEEKALPLSDGERRRLAFLTRYHRGHVPEDGWEYLDASRDDATNIRTILGLLRAADGLDARSGNGAQLIITVRGRIVTIYGHYVGESFSSKSLPGKKKKMKLLEGLLGCEVRTEWFRADGVGVVS